LVFTFFFPPPPLSLFYLLQPREDTGTSRSPFPPFLSLFFLPPSLQTKIEGKIELKYAHFLFPLPYSSPLPHPPFRISVEFWVGLVSEAKFFFLSFFSLPFFFLFFFPPGEERALEKEIVPSGTAFLSFFFSSLLSSVFEAQSL